MNTAMSHNVLQHRGDRVKASSATLSLAVSEAPSSFAACGPAVRSGSPQSALSCSLLRFTAGGGRATLLNLHCRHRSVVGFRVGPWIRRTLVVVLLTAAQGLMLGCSGMTWGSDLAEPVDEPALRREAIAYLKQAVSYEHAATIRCQAIEALAEEAPRGAEGWFIESLSDDSPAVRFAACVALGRLTHLPAKSAVRQRLSDENHSVRAAAIFALHRMGEYSHSGRLAEMLLYHKSREVRRNAAMLFGLLGEPKAIKLLTRAQEDSDPLVVWQALESRMLLNDPKALGRVASQVNSGRADIRVLAMLAAGRSGNPKCAEVLRYRLNREDDHIEARLAAARGLGLLGQTDGMELAKKSLTFDSPDPDPRAGRPEDQIMRVRSMAALALGTMRAKSALRDLKRLMNESQDARIQVAAARAILMIVKPPSTEGERKVA